MKSAKQACGVMAVRIMVTVIAVVGMTASARIFYCNTFDAAGDNVRLGDDATEPTDFFQLAGSSGTVTSGTFDGTYTNVGDAAASGTHARYIDIGGSSASQFGMQAVNGSFDHLLYSMNLLEPGEYDLSISMDLAASEHGSYTWWNREVNILVQLKGTGSAGDGSWNLVFYPNDSGVPGYTTTSFRHYTWTGVFELTDAVMDPSLYTENQFLSGSFSSVYFKVSMDSRHTGALTTNLDNLTFSSIGIPEPASVVLLGLGGLLVVRRRRVKDEG